ncbi:hypothetical protein Hanom_Chr01g00036261 [Helianthus anomalus]
MNSGARWCYYFIGPHFKKPRVGPFSTVCLPHIQNLICSKHIAHERKSVCEREIGEEMGDKDGVGSPALTRGSVAHDSGVEMTKGIRRRRSLWQLSGVVDIGEEVSTGRRQSGNRICDL